MLDIKRVAISNVSEAAPLFDAYRVFYGQETDIDAAREFLKLRILNKDSVILLALWQNKAVGFTQLYTTFSSVSLEPFYILNDLFVDSEYRGKGIGEALLNEAKKYCEKFKYKGLALETAVENPARHLYEKLGWKRDNDYFHYFWTNPK